MSAWVERWTGVDWKSQGPAFTVGLGHGCTHWTLGTFYILLPFITKELGLTYTQAGAIVTVMHASSFAANLGSGMVVDVTGKRVMIQSLSLIIGAAALMASGQAEQVAWMFAMACLIGITSNAWHPAAISFLSLRYPGNRGYALSIHSLGASLGDMAAPAAAGALVAAMTWREAAMYNALPVFLIALVIAATLTRMDRGESVASTKTESFAAYMIGIKRMVRDKAVLGLCVMSGFRLMTQNGLMFFLPLYLINELGVTAVVMGLAVMGMQAGGVIAGPVAGAWSDRIGRKPLMLMGLSAATVIIFGLTLANHEVIFISGIAVLGFVLYAVRPVLHSWVMDVTPPELGGSATSLLFGTQSAFSMAVPIIGGAIADRWGLPSVFYMLAATMVIANCMVYILPNDRAKKEAPA